MHLARKRQVMPGSQNRPMLAGVAVDTLDYAEAISAGFTSVYRTLLRHREALLADEGPLGRFAADEVRVILRATRTYAVLLRESFHPDVLRDALDRDRLFDQLWATIEQQPYLARVISAERDDLQQGDIPMFTTRPGSTDLWTSRHERIADFSDTPGLALAQQRVQQLSEMDLVRQHWFIRASLATLSRDRGQRSRHPLPAPQTLADPEHLLAAACAIGDRLETLALHGEQEVSWIGLTLAREHDWSLAPLDLDLYGGLSGVTLFLAYLGAVTGEPRYTALAQASVPTLRRQVEHRRAYLPSIGGFSGWGGVIYTLTHLGCLWDQPALLTEADALVELLPALITRDEQLDVIGGAAGCIGSLLSLHQCAPSAQTLAAAVQCGDRLLACAQPMAQGIGWRIPASPQPLAGFAHGAAGMAWALWKLFAHTGAERFRTAALAAMAYERSLFAPEVGNWPDLRQHEAAQKIDQPSPPFMTAWCHGAAGIGLARLQVLPYLDDVATRAEIETALQTTLASGFGYNHSLCHGDLGNLELLLQAGELFEDAQWRQQVHRLAAIGLASIARDGWRCGVPLGTETPGLMTGLAGIGYGLLRLAAAARVPSVLVLAPPPQCMHIQGDATVPAILGQDTMW
jgi:type 2 lantibiotic biosynthesis protein LanM